MDSHQTTAPLEGFTEGEQGFTLVELLVTFATIAVLVGIMSSIWSMYRTRAHNTAAVSDLRNGLIALEAYLDDNENYPTCIGQVCKNNLRGLALSPGVYIAFAQTAGRQGTSVACHTDSGDTAYIRSTVVDLIVEMPIGTCGSGS